MYMCNVITSRRRKNEFPEAGAETISTLIRPRCAARIYLRIVRAAWGWETRMRTGRREGKEGGRWGHRVEGGMARGERRRRTGREHNVSHSARSCIFYDMASNLTSRARHNSRPCGPCVCPRMRESSLVFPTRCIARRGIGTCTRVYIEHARAHEESLHTCACAHALRAGQVRVASERIETIRGRGSS